MGDVPADRLIAVTGTVRLRRFDPAEASQELLHRLLGMYTDPETVRLVDGPDAGPYDMAKLLRMYRHLHAHGELYLIEEHSPAGWWPVGDVTLSPTMIPIVVAPHARGRGIGRRVIARLVARARELGWAAVRVSDIDDFNEVSRRMFTSLGFTPVGPTTHGHSYRLQLD